MGGDDTAQIYFMRQVLALMDANPSVERRAPCLPRITPAHGAFSVPMQARAPWTAPTQQLLPMHTACEPMQQGQGSWVLWCRYAWFAPDVSAPIFNWVGAAASLLANGAPSDIGQVCRLMRLVCVCPQWFVICRLTCGGLDAFVRLYTTMAKQGLTKWWLSDCALWQRTGSFWQSLANLQV